MDNDQTGGVAVSWPIVLFEADGWPVIVRTAHDLSDVYEDNYWDEIVDAFDAETRHLSVEFVDGSPLVRRAADAAGPSFTRRARAALDRFDRRGAIRWHPAEPDRQREIAQLREEELWRELMGRFGER